MHVPSSKFKVRLEYGFPSFQGATGEPASVATFQKFNYLGFLHCLELKSNRPCYFIYSVNVLTSPQKFLCLYAPWVLLPKPLPYRL
jgi:hypothetical protein